MYSKRDSSGRSKCSRTQATAYSGMHSSQSSTVDHRKDIHTKVTVRPVLRNVYNNVPQRGRVSTADTPSISVTTLTKSSEVSLPIVVSVTTPGLFLDWYHTAWRSQKQKHVRFHRVYELKELKKPTCRVQYIWLVEKMFQNSNKGSSACS